MAVSGTMKGKIKEYRLIDNQLIATIDFVSNRVGRMNYEGMRVHADTISPRQIGMGFNLSEENQPTGTFEFPKDDKIIKSIFYSNGLGGRLLSATEGVVKLKNLAPDKVQISGQLSFTTEDYDGRYFQIHVDYKIAGMGEMP
ncbi:hypothetical protein [Pseudomonas koreensis]|uniref:hypothetical protein n=1 Tax=Pseudomonas koreensis TaxID=198620 RepID=UPI003D972AE8